MSSGTWGDLRPRLISAAVMIAVGALAIYSGGGLWLALVLCVTGLMVWELARITAADAGPVTPVVLGLAAAASLGTALVFAGTAGLLALLIVPAAFALTPRQLKPVAVFYALAILLAGAGLAALRGQGMGPLFWLLAVVITSDVAGYFAGRAFGGPKFWPSVSPKKTWSGTVAGWVGSALVGAGFVIWDGAPLSLIPFSALVAFAGQMGDILESWLKRRMGIKDSSALIPGHGGFLDRFDAILMAAVVVMIANQFFYLPLVGTL